MKRGFTLIEIITSAAILGVLILGLLNIYTWCLDMQTKSGNRASAINQMRNLLEEMRNHVETHNNDVSALLTYDGETRQLTGMAGGIYAEVARVGAGPSQLADIRLVAGWVGTDGEIVGEGHIDAGSGDFVFNDNLDGDKDGVIESPYILQTAIAAK